MFISLQLILLEFHQQKCVSQVPKEFRLIIYFIKYSFHAVEVCGRGAYSHCFTRYFRFSSSSELVVWVSGGSVEDEDSVRCMYTGGLPITHSSVMCTLLISDPGTSNIGSNSSDS